MTRAGRAAALLIGSCLAAGVLAGVALHSARRAPAAVVFPRPSRALTGDAVWPAGRRRAPAFALRDQRGRLVSLAGQRGHPVLLTFMDSRCRLICTLQGPQIAAILRRAGRGVRLLVVSVNPWEDTAASSVRAGARYGFAGPWHWLRAAPAALRPVWRAYGIDVIRTTGDVSHSTALYVIDRRGYERAGFNFPFPQRQVARDLRALA
ncbi:MAG TPA: SCO family protein [Solirubrobacteraceae bacterium]|jgi:cytochrome oxidase Cu insertion factor (SCO1/SenC/PrrC family)